MSPHAAFFSDWSTSLRADVADPRLATATLAALLQRWSEPHRYYHTLTHLRACLDDWRAQFAAFAAPHDVGLALFYHDAVYDPQRSDNEAASAALADAELARLGIPVERRACINRLILASDHRPAPSDTSARADDTAHADADRFLAIDLAILAAAPSDYRCYAANTAMSATLPGASAALPCCAASSRARVSTARRAAIPPKPRLAATSAPNSLS